LKPPDRLAVDANPILSALLGGQARRVFFESAIGEFAVPEHVIVEVQRYVPRLAQNLGVQQAFLDYALNLLPLQVYPARRYARAIREARCRIERAIRPTSTCWPLHCISTCRSGRTIAI
jgi:hypothetical protein